ncbi:AAA family ATPase [Longirhabdus pacifica]|uniref:AAA family ATPase n=1 Tax=Longirhabdus pacifica TaxID=2305227 RepID=UPI001008D6DE|nr:AAA family ATPase [Longirhabdus pacifica]
MSERVAERAHARNKARQINIILNVQQETSIKKELPQKEPVPSLYDDEVTALFKELNHMIGLDKVKEMMFEIYALLKIRKIRSEEGLKTDTHVFHMLFKGNPGTGKTTVARVVAKLFAAMGVLSKGHLVEVERADLVGEYIGHTAIKTRELVKKAMGGILFIDEAYSLGRGGEKDFGKEAIDALVKHMEDEKDEFILILAGYTQEMDDFLTLNPGLDSRFPIQIQFPDYALDELLSITHLMLEERQYVLSPQAMAKFQSTLSYAKQSHHFSNGRYIRNLIEKAIRRQAVRLIKSSHTTLDQSALMTIEAQDLKNE